MGIEASGFRLSRRDVAGTQPPDSLGTDMESTLQWHLTSLEVSGLPAMLLLADQVPIGNPWLAHRL